VTYRYDDADGDVHQRPRLRLPPGLVNGRLGETGAGKTTLELMLLAQLRPQFGRVEINDATRARELSPRMLCNFV
jgi:ABC-type bacteriocin/lantibiotic exporter with double-glycine peptidase domain